MPLVISDSPLSGAAERYDDFIYITEDNETHANTGRQRSGISGLSTLLPAVKNYTKWC